MKTCLWFQNNLLYLLMRHTLAHPTAHIVRGAEAILCGLGAQVHHLVEAELAAID